MTLMRIGENTNKDSSKHQQPIGENAKDIYKNINNNKYNKNSHYSNKNIDKSRTHLNYHLKEPMQSYEKEFERIRKEHNLKGQIKEVSNIACSEFWKTKDSYRKLQDAYYEYMKSHNFDIERQMRVNTEFERNNDEIER